MSDGAIVLERVSKRYRPSRRPPGAPAFLWRRAAMDEDLAGLEEDDDDEEEDEEPGDEEARAADREVWALRDVSLEVAPGTALGIVGPAGSGKSTLLKILSRVTLPTSGRAIVKGTVAPVAQVPGLLLRPELTGRGNAYLVAKFLGVPREVVDRRMNDIAELAELGPLLDKKVREYSTSYKARLGHAIILNLEPDVLLADGSLTTGDHTFRDRCLRHLRAARRSGLTIVLATQDVDTVRGFCDEAVLLEEGSIVERGAPNAIVSLYQERRAQQRALVLFRDDETDDEHQDGDAGTASAPESGAPVSVDHRARLRSSYTPGATPATLPAGERTLLLIDRITEERGWEESHRIVHEAERLASDAGDTRLRWRHLAEVIDLPFDDARELVLQLGAESGLTAKRRVFNEHAAVVGGGLRREGEWSWIETRIEVAAGGTGVDCVVQLVPDEGGQVRLVQPVPILLERPGPWWVRIRLRGDMLSPGAYSAQAIVKTAREDVRGTIWHPDLFHFHVDGDHAPAGPGPFEVLWEFGLEE